MCILATDISIYPNTMPGINGMNKKLIDDEEVTNEEMPHGI